VSDPRMPQPPQSGSSPGDTGQQGATGWGDPSQPAQQGQWGQQGQPGYGQGYGGQGQLQEAPTGVAALICGILGFVVLPLILSIAAIILGSKAKKAAAAEPHRYKATLGSVGYVLGWIGVVLMVLGVLFFVSVGGFAP
jgi:hypothetical protein